MARLFLVIVITLFTACAGPNTNRVEKETPPDAAKPACNGCINPNQVKTTEFRGVLKNTKLAPSIVGKDFRVYCLGPSLPEGMMGKEVRATGRLEYTNEFAAPPVEESPHAQSQGTSGQDLVLRECTVSVLASD